MDGQALAAHELSDGRLRVATYNVHECIGRDGAYAPDRIAAIVAGLDADIVALQEVTLDHAGDVVALLKATTGMHPIDGTLFERGAGRYGNLLLSRWPALSERLHDLSFPRREPRGLMDVVCRVRGAEWRVLATHLGLSRRERRAQIARIAGLADGSRQACVLLGDFNVWLGSLALAPLIRNGFEQCRRPSYPTWAWPVLPLDRILVRSPARCLRCQRVEVSPVPVASDHYPVVADLAQD